MPASATDGAPFGRAVREDAPRSSGRQRAARLVAWLVVVVAVVAGLTWTASKRESTATTQPFERSANGRPPSAPGRLRNDVVSARSVVFVCDASRMMFRKIASAKNEMSDAIAALAPGQAFNVVYLQKGTAMALSGSGPVPLDNDHLRLAYRFIDDVYVTGDSSPLPDLAAAVRGRPDLVCLLTNGDGDPETAAALRDAARRLNADGRVRVNVVAFIEDIDHRFADDDTLDVLRAIARENGGTFRYVSEVRGTRK